MLTVEPAIIEKYVRPGKVKLVFRDVLNHGERSLRTSEAAACAGKQNQFWQIHAILFERQGDVYATSNDQLVERMQSWGKELRGLDQIAFAKCVTERATLKALQDSDAAQRARGIISQPIFEIGARRLAGLQSVEAMAAALDAAMK